MFEWDEEKRLQNIEIHGVDFLDAALIFENAVLEAVDPREDYGETRYRALGHADDNYFHGRLCETRRKPPTYQRLESWREWQTKISESTR